MKRCSFLSAWLFPASRKMCTARRSSGCLCDRTPHVAPHQGSERSAAVCCRNSTSVKGWSAEVVLTSAELTSMVVKSLLKGSERWGAWWCAPTRGTPSEQFYLCFFNGDSAHHIVPALTSGQQ
jgi:hypothetical protein